MKMPQARAYQGARWSRAASQTAWALIFRRSNSDELRRLRLATFRRLSGLKDFEQAGRAHSAADAHRHDDIFGTAPLALDQSVAGQASARHAVRMADRDGAAIDVEPVVGD